MTSYVVGFMFDTEKQRVALIRKQKPIWQNGLLNGIGGKIEPNESAAQAMAREFKEESGFESTAHDWSYFLRLTDEEAFEVDCFALTGNIDLLRSNEREKIEIVSLSDITPLRKDMIENICWMVSLALDHLEDARPAYIVAIYPVQKIKTEHHTK